MKLTHWQVEIINAALYFDVFKYPLTKAELFENSTAIVSKEKFTEDLDLLIKNNFLKQEDGFILSNERTKQDILKRLSGNKGAKEIMPAAYEYGRKIARFPFVEGVCLSGGLSKNYYDEKGDFDFFIITKPGRLWICRSLLILRYKFLPAGKKKFWCVNYFVSSGSLAIADANEFTATELAHLIPAVNYNLYRKLLLSNGWYKKHFPNKPVSIGTGCTELPAYAFKSFCETLLKGRFGQWLDNRLLNITLKRWRKKYPELSDEDFELQFRSRKDVCKRHTHGFQNKVLLTWREKKLAYEKQFNVSLSSAGS